ncbi:MULTISPECIES: acyl-CoA thioesterase [unclassified Mesorhizobium]|uniref:acyl-CoA thioesterase n=1 Tax=unclassified Mesorhizobium TaxID=325217 RepID=UPI0003CEF316|nr:MULTISPECIES: acyl-CoA thioesterase [unclassified Mesorhizobium]ESW82112.1 4-hydroxybenzoyl-CoA thioesterase [Mesorhizobium sp. LSJC285A00]ESX63092.1 4-hydroxybenzoyl-CoA thioesterase [Mesorhizobium sp. LSHC422A00]ESZ09209.1 4-hydroxybenzoyl-CoA thioesterase [Mesorhizobium sp. L2C089B000]ESZ15966.1 4-hydroxybenzoyl-CoA thioesterase [Mesorhizobium sp. L2C085B000]
MTAPGIETYVGVVHPWMCDAMGHLNVRHYVAMFDDASFQLLGRIAAPNLTPTLGWADVRMEIDYAHETAVGTLVTIRSVVEKVGKSSLTYLHEMRGTLDDVLHARMRTVTVRFDLQARSKIEIEGKARQASANLPRGEADAHAWSERRS